MTTFRGSRPPRVSISRQGASVTNLLEQAQTLSEEQLQNIEGSFRLSEEIAHQGIATATPSFSQRLQSFGYSLVSPDTTPNRNLFDRE